MTIEIDMDGRVVVVTGATGGIGQGIVRRFADAGATVAVHFRTDSDAAARLATEVGGIAICADLTNPAGPETVVAAVVEQRGRIDVVVNNAATQASAHLTTMSDDEWTTTIDTNLTAVHRLTQVAAAAMEDGGSIIHIASIEGSQPAPGHGHYAVSKAAVIMHAKAAALEWGASGIRVNAVSPGLIDRPGLVDDWADGVARWHAAAPLERLGTPADVGAACVFLASDLAAWVTGINLVVDGGVSARPTW